MASEVEAKLAIAELDARECARDCREFIARHVKIEDRDVEGLEVAFDLWEAQEDVLECFVSERLVAVLKARQLGLTWLALSYAVWRMVFRKGYSVLALSRSENEAKELVRRIVFILTRLPKWIIREKKSDVPVDWPGPVWSATALEVTVEHGDLESGMSAMASGQNTGRSFTASLVLLDEWAFMQWAREIWSAIYPSVNRPTGGQVIGISTAARGTLFERIWEGAEGGANDFVPIFLSWRADPRRDDAWYERTKRQMELLALEGQEGNIHQEYPETAAEAFMASGSSVFDVQSVMERRKALRGAERVFGELEVAEEDDVVRLHESDRNFEVSEPKRVVKVRFRERERSWLEVFRKPEAGVPYVIGGDTAEAGVDYCVAQVLDNRTGEQVARWRGRVDTDVFGKEIWKLGLWYNEALVGIEVNFDLHPVKELQRLGYRRQYQRESLDRVTKRRREQLGWRTTTGNRQMMLSYLVQTMREEPELVNDVVTLDEMLTFVRNERGKAEALSGKHDDCIMSLAIAHQIRGQQRTDVVAEKEEPRGVWGFDELRMKGWSKSQIRRMEKQGVLKVLH